MDIVKLLYIAMLLFYIYFVFYKSKKFMQMLQQNWYNDGNRYLIWIKENFSKCFISVEVLFLFLVCFKGIKSIIFAIIMCVVSYIFYSSKIYKTQNKKPLVFTARIKRLYTTFFILYLAVIILSYEYFSIHSINKYIAILGLMAYLVPFIIWIANIINKPIEKLVFQYYLRKAKDKLYNMTNLKRIGITGSYGKTSTKNALNDILSVKFNSFATEKSFNTMNGLMISINNKLDKFTDIFVAEMGAFRQGEIKQKCDFIKPQYGILTIIGNAHADSFGDIHNTQKAKFELIDSLPEDGIGILNMDDPLQVEYEVKSKCKIVWVSTNNIDADVYAYDIKLSSSGTKFKCDFKDGKKGVLFETRLLGSANVYNILESIALAYNLGMNTDQIALGVKKIECVEHRLQLRRFTNEITIIDDAYNSNPVGSSMAVDVLGMMDGKKIIVTPGMIELGEGQYELNKEFGKHIADVCDEVILVGTEQTKPIYDGLKEKKYNEDNIHILNDVKEAFPLIRRLNEGKTFALLENDLPDIFNE